MKPFHTTAPAKYKWDGGYAGGTINPPDLADELFGEEISGPWLTCYMLRRFGWPNAGSDDYKELMSWCLTTPVKGLYLGVTPYLGGSNLHFNIRFTRAIQRKIEHDPVREAFWKRQRKFLDRWWKKKGSKLYLWGYGFPDEKDELVHLFADNNKTANPTLSWGLWKRTPKTKGSDKLPRNLQMRDWWLCELLKAKHPDVNLPQFPRTKGGRRYNAFKRQCDHALKRTMLDLLRDTHVRDINFNIFGMTERKEDSYAKKPKPVITPAAGYWHGAGNTPEYWFSKQAAKERAKAALSSRYR